MINFPELPEEEFDENNLITSSFLEKATAYLELRGYKTIPVYNRYNAQNSKKGTTPTEYSIKKFFVKLCNAAGLYDAVADDNLKNDINFALLCSEQQPLSYFDMPKIVQLNDDVIHRCSANIINHDVKNILHTNYENFTQEEKSALLKLKFNLRFNGEKFPRLGIKNQDVIKEILKVNPNIYNYIGKMQDDPEIIAFIKNVPLKYGIASLARMFGKNTNDGYVIPKKYKERFSNLFEEQRYYYVHGFYR